MGYFGIYQRNDKLKTKRLSTHIHSLIVKLFKYYIEQNHEYLFTGTGTGSRMVTSIF